MIQCDARDRVGGLGDGNLSRGTLTLCGVWIERVCLIPLPPAIHLMKSLTLSVAVFGDRSSPEVIIFNEVISVEF